MKTTMFHKWVPGLTATTAGSVCLFIIAFSTLAEEVPNTNAPKFLATKTFGDDIIIPAPEGYVKVPNNVSKFVPQNVNTRGWNILLPELSVVNRYGDEKREAYMLAVFVPLIPGIKSMLDIQSDAVKLLGDKNYVPVNACTVQILSMNLVERTLEDYQYQKSILEKVYAESNRRNDGGGTRIPGAMNAFQSPKNYGEFIAGPDYAAWLTSISIPTTVTDVRVTRISYIAVVTISLYLKGRILFLRMYKDIPRPAEPADLSDYATVRKYKEDVAKQQFALRNVEAYRKSTANWIRAVFEANGVAVE